MYKFGEEVSFEFKLLEAGDYDNLQSFECENEKLDDHIRNHVIENGEIVSDDGLYFKFTDINTDKIIGIVSLTTSGILFEVDKYTHVLPAIKIDVFAIDKNYKKMHYTLESKNSDNPADHYYLSDELMACVIQHCITISNQYALAEYILLYADINALRFYERKYFTNYSKYMVRENNQEVGKNIPMYFELAG